MDFDILLKKVEDKIISEAKRLGDKIPYIPENGKYIDMGERDMSWWTNGFWPGMLNLVWYDTKNEDCLKSAEAVENRMDEAFATFTGLHHDVGFMWLHSAVASYKMRGDKRSFARGLHAATILAGRYNPLTKCIRSWNEGYDGYEIIDSMMNIGILYWASEVTKDPSFETIAKHHADTLIRTHLKDDGHVIHIANLDPYTGEVREIPVGQGAFSGSAWSRGQAWGLYGFALSYLRTKEPRYLDAACKIASYLLSELPKYNYIPPVDFMADNSTSYHVDTTAAMCMACGFLELSNFVDSTLSSSFIDCAKKLVANCVDAWGDLNPETDGILSGGSCAYHHHTFEEKILYGDYFLLEALLRLENRNYLIW